MVNGSTLPNQEQIEALMPKYVIKEVEGPRTFYRVGVIDGPVAAWDARLNIGVVLDTYRQYIYEKRNKRSER